ncbi:MAG: TetR family transcriptional regulator [Oscillospiraceae bacterium]|nr:TetR family transcriptional regulator [Oscillospiraceae bacterium]
MAKMGQKRMFCIMEAGYAVEKITDGLLELMKETPFEEITISDIVRKAGVGRASFYRHFDSKEAVVRHHMARLLKEWGREFEAIGKLEELGPSLLRHFYGHRYFYLLLHRCGMSHYLLEAIRETMELDHKSDQEVYPLSWFAGGLYGVVDEWMRRGMSTLPEDMEAMLSK